MILLISNKSDIHCNPVVDELNRIGADFFRLNTDDIHIDYDFDFQINHFSKNYFYITNKHNQKKIDLLSVTAIWERRPYRPKIKSNLPDSLIDAATEELAELTWWIRSFCSIDYYIGHHSLDRIAENKILQLHTVSIMDSVEKYGVYIPQTVIANNETSLHNFANYFTHFTVKPIGADSVQVEKDMELPLMSAKVPHQVLKGVDKNNVSLSPAFVQQYIDKKYELRITVVGTEFFTCRIDSKKLPVGAGREDWRQGYDVGLPQTYIQTPENLKSFICDYMFRFQINFGCFDFIVDEVDRYYFLECNPNGQWLWVEHDLGIPISKAIARYLLGDINRVKN
ncbi:hypothetical protein N8199_04490 [Emcibacteraceae bacterium]|nr:hypothetical protein [Emcibacteraceae bacterium]